MPEKRDDVVIGVDVGTLSGRALVPLRVGAELDTAVHPYVHQGLLT
jgi:ribulose kinase